MQGNTHVRAWRKGKKAGSRGVSQHGKRRMEIKRVLQHLQGCTVARVQMVILNGRICKSARFASMLDGWGQCIRRMGRITNGTWDMKGGYLGIAPQQCRADRLKMATGAPECWVIHFEKDVALVDQGSHMGAGSYINGWFSSQPGKVVCRVCHQ